MTNVLCTVSPRVGAVVKEVGNECQDAKDNSGHSCNAELFSVHQWNSVNIHLCSCSVSGSCGGGGSWYTCSVSGSYGGGGGGGRSWYTCSVSGSYGGGGGGR